MPGMHRWTMTGIRRNGSLSFGYHRLDDFGSKLHQKSLKIIAMVSGIH